MLISNYFFVGIYYIKNYYYKLVFVTLEMF